MKTARHWLLAGAFLITAACAQAQDHSLDATMLQSGGAYAPLPSQAVDEKSYRVDAARHIYQNYPALVHRGQLPARLHAVTIVETTIDENGAVEKVEVIRDDPHAKAATPWIVGMIQAAQPYPPAAQLGKVTYRDIWLIAQGRFQLDAITEGQVRQSAALAP